jgi:2,3-bisphosphoglycerate-independent phosphoglycerate mutase
VIDFPYLSQIIRKNDAKILLFVVAGLGGAPDPTLGRSELEAARVPTLDHIAQQSSGGLSIPVAPGIAPGSIISNLALLGYDPLKQVFGRGALEAIGAGLDLQPGDIALRGNLAKIDGNGVVTDRRAGGLSTDDAAPLIERLAGIEISGVETQVAVSLGYRFAVRFRGAGLSADVTDTDPMEAGVSALESQGAKKTANAVNAFVAQAATALAGGYDANAVLLRGAAAPPSLVSFADSYQLKPAAITAYPLHQGLAQATGMHLYPVTQDFQAHLDALHRHWDDHDFFWVHYEEPSATPDSMDFNDKRRSIEAIDEHVRQILELRPDVLVITSDHANPSAHAGHTWHGVPFVIRSAGTVADRGVDRFNERDLRLGSLGQFEAKHAMMLTLAHAGKLKQFGS